jgi:hypothetical protein
MSPLDLLHLLLAVITALLWLCYVVEAFRDSTAQGLLTLLLPLYVLYYAFIRSRYGPQLRFAFTVCVLGLTLWW